MMHRAIADKLIKVLDAVFADLKTSLEEDARNCGNNDASTALYGVAHAVDMIYMKGIVYEALDIPINLEDDKLDALKIPTR
jgi:pyruvate-formate lyase-activating enzyme